MAQVPAATRTLRVLRYLASQPDPVPLDAIARACALPRSSAYHLVTAMVAEGLMRLSWSARKAILLSLNLPPRRSRGAKNS